MEFNLENVFKSEVHIKILLFFHENQGSIDTPRGIATWTGYNRNVVKKALTELASMGVLIAHSVSSTTAYSYTQDKGIIKIINKRLKKLNKGG